MKISILLLFVAFFVNIDVTYGLAGIPDKLRNEFRSVATSRLDYMLKHGQSTDSQQTMSFIVTDCQTAQDPKIKTSGGQTFLEEAICGTVQMHEWCDEKPGRTGVLTTLNEKTNRTMLAHFMCDIEHPTSRNHNLDQYITKRVINYVFVFSIIGILFSWYIICSRPIPIHPSNILNLSNKSSTYPSDSFENITFDSTKSPSKSRIANSNRSNYSTAPKKFRIIV